MLDPDHYLESYFHEQFNIIDTDVFGDCNLYLERTLKKTIKYLEKIY